MPFLSLPMILQLLLIIHVLRNNKERFWIYILIFVPIAGGIAYLVVEVLPDLSRGRTARVAQSAVVDLVAPNKNLNELERAARFSPTVKNLRLLADEYTRHERFKEAIDLYRQCLSGPFSEDEEIRLKLANALYETNGYTEADDILTRLEEKAGATIRPRVLLLHGRTMEKAGNVARAEELYEEAARLGSGMEHRYLYANFLFRIGRRTDAYKLYETMVEEYRMMPSFSKRDNRHWMRRVEQDMKAP